MENIEKMLCNVNDILLTYDIAEKENGEKFNYFSVLKIEKAEVKHSAFIAELLNPKGLHGQGDIFLKLFIELYYPIFQTKNTKVQIEKDLGKEINEEMKEEKIGRTDIFITNKTNCIVIENKIDAGEQSKQLERYHKYCTKNFPNKFKLFYLTREGEFAKDADNLEKGKDYFCISYRKDLLEWLKKCLEKCENKPVLCQSISQYISIIKKITNQINSKAMEEIHKVIRENLNAAKSISEEYDKILTDVSNGLRNDVLKRLRTEYPQANIETGDFGRDSWASSIWIDSIDNLNERIGIESFNTKGKHFGSALFIGKFINSIWVETIEIMSNDKLLEKLDEYGKNENREMIVKEIVDYVKDYVKRITKK